eukprot:Sdes_comp22826_c0_seq1m21213
MFLLGHNNLASSNHISENAIEYTASVIQTSWEADKYAPLKLQKLSYFIRSLLVKTNSCSSCLVVALFYLKKLKAKFPNCGREGCAQRLFLSALLIACKYMYDESLNNRSWAILSGLSLSSVNTMELKLLKGLGYDMHIASWEYQSLLAEMTLFICPLYSFSACSTPSLPQDLLHIRNPVTASDHDFSQREIYPHSYPTNPNPVLSLSPCKNMPASLQLPPALSKKSIPYPKVSPRRELKKHLYNPIQNGVQLHVIPSGFQNCNANVPILFSPTI